MRGVNIFINDFNKEINILEFYKHHFEDHYFYKTFAINQKEGVQIAKKISQLELWQDNSSNTNTGADFICRKHKLLMDVMRINGCEGKKGKNSEYNFEHEALKEFYENIDYLDSNINMVYLDTSLEIQEIPDKDWQTYSKYLKQFERVVKKHNSKNEIYKKGFEKYKTILFVFDETEGFIYSNDTWENGVSKRKFNGKIHNFYLDNNFLNIISSLDVDFLVWYAPYKIWQFLKSTSSIVLPSIIIYNIQLLKKVRKNSSNNSCFHSGFDYPDKERLFIPQIGIK